MAKVYKGRFEAHRVGPKRHPRYVIGTSNSGTTSVYYTGRDRFRLDP